VDSYGVFAEQAELFRAAVGTADPAARVPSCPGWTFGHLAVHVGRFLSVVTRYLTTASPVELPPERPADPTDPLEFLDERLAAADTALAECPANRPMWTFSPAAPDLAWVWQRRAAHELNLRRWDAQAALRTLTPTDQAQAVDAIDEVLTTLLAARLRQDSPPTTAGTAVVRCTDTPRAWFVRLAPGEVPDVRPATADAPDAELANRAENVLYQLWGRMRLTGTGSSSVLRALRMA
jgi:mycothiol maleylpyruvate isomerase-like protein